MVLTYVTFMSVSKSFPPQVLFFQKFTEASEQKRRKENSNISRQSKSFILYDVMNNLEYICLLVLALRPWAFHSHDRTGVHGCLKIN